MTVMPLPTIMQAARRMQQRLAGLSLVFLILLGTVLPGFADQQLSRSGKSAVYVQIHTGMDPGTTEAGIPFEGVTRENYFYRNSALPVGTVLRGHVYQIKPSRRAARPGFVQLDLEEVQFPSGRIVSLKTNRPGERPSKKDNTKGKTGLRTKKLTHPEAVRFPVLLEMGAALTLGSAAVDIPVKFITGWSNFIILGFGTGVRIIEGIAAEYLPGERRWHNHRGHSWPYRYGHGFIRGVGILGAYYMIKRSPNPKLGESEMLPLRFDKHGLDRLFIAAREEAGTVPFMAVPAGWKPEKDTDPLSPGDFTEYPR